ncbi:hypothetical protein [Bacillus sp. BP-3]|nr:hypothetical protein [Bacillus sp. BP-3]
MDKPLFFYKLFTIDGMNFSIFLTMNLADFMYVFGRWGYVDKT